MKEKWFKNIEEGKLQEMQNIYQELRSKGFERSVKNWKPGRFAGNTALIMAQRNGHLHICQWLVRENLMDVNLKDDNGWNVLHEAASLNGLEISRNLRWLLEETSIDINAQTSNGDTALHLAVRNENIEVTRILLEHNALLLKKNHYPHWTALDEARSHNEEMVHAITMEEYNVIDTWSYHDIGQIIELLRTHYNIRR